MHTTRSPMSIQPGMAGDALDLSLSGSQLSMGRRPSSASPGKHFSRSISVSVAGDGRGKRNTLVSLHLPKHVTKGFQSDFSYLEYIMSYVLLSDVGRVDISQDT